MKKGRYSLGEKTAVAAGLLSEEVAKLTSSPITMANAVPVDFNVSYCKYWQIVRIMPETY